MASEEPATHRGHLREAVKDQKDWLGAFPSMVSSLLPAVLQLGCSGCFLQCDDSVMEEPSPQNVQPCQASGMLMFTFASAALLRTQPASWGPQKEGREGHLP